MQIVEVLPMVICMTIYHGIFLIYCVNFIDQQFNGLEEIRHVCLTIIAVVVIERKFFLTVWADLIKVVFSTLAQVEERHVINLVSLLHQAD